MILQAKERMRVQTDVIKITGEPNLDDDPETVPPHSMRMPSWHAFDENMDGLRLGTRVDPGVVKSGCCYASCNAGDYNNHLLV
jgi:hypothetical protein